MLECGGGQASDLIAAIGQAFELRYNEFFNKSQWVTQWNAIKTNEHIYCADCS